MSIDRTELQDSARRAFGEGGFAPDAAKSWNLISEMGWLMMAVPEELDGLGLGREAEGVIHTELGRALVCGPVIAQMLVIEALVAANDFAERSDLLSRAMSGEVMTSSLVHALDADKASYILTVNADRVALVPMHAAGVSYTLRNSWDKTRRLFDVTIPDDAEAIILASGDCAVALTQRLQSQLLFALSGDALGGANAVLDLTVEYLKMRRQFDRPLALFQALKHRIADMKAQLVTAEALFWARSKSTTVSLTEMASLKAHACGVYRAIAEEAIQLHGGIGLTMEHDCHLFLKRAMLNCVLGGDADFHDEMAGRQLLDQFS